jgi:hypothetical protein
MEKLIQDYLGAWYSNGGELFMYFDLAGAYGKFGCWGLTEDIRKPTPKTAGILDVLKTPLPKEVAGASIPGTVPAWPPTASNGGAGIKDAEGHEFLGQMSDDHYFDYLINVKEAGDYTFSMQTASGLDGAQVEVLFSGDSIGMMTSKNTGDWYKFAATEPVAVHLEKGQLVVRLKLRKSALNVMSFTLEKR